jgi:hypothetical protein
MDMTMGFGAGAAGAGGACAAAVMACTDKVAKIKKKRKKRIGFTLPELVVVLNRARAPLNNDKNDE